MKYIIFYGTSANPIHQGHIDLVAESIKGLTTRSIQVAQVITVPVYRRNPVGDSLKHDLPDSFEHRIAMCRLASEEIRRRLHEHGSPIAMDVSNIAETLSKNRQKPNYDLETLITLKSEYGSDAGLISLMSADLFSGAEPEFGRWHKPEQIVRTASIALAPRRGYEPNRDFLSKLERAGATFIYLEEVAITEISATEVRRRIAVGSPLADLVSEHLIPQSIADYIQRNPDLYGPQ